MKTAFAVVLCLLIVSCSYPVANVYRGFEQNGDSFDLFNIRIQHWKELRFSGLLALQRKTDKLFYALLDSSGITLIEAEIGSGGEHNLIQAKGMMKTSDLPEYLSTALYRVFQLDPEQYPCSRNGLMSYCLETTGKRKWRKHATAGPFTLWDAEGGISEDRLEPEIVYEHPWGGVLLSLKRIKR